MCFRCIMFSTHRDDDCNRDLGRLESPYIILLIYNEAIVLDGNYL